MSPEELFNHENQIWEHDSIYSAYRIAWLDKWNALSAQDGDDWRAWRYAALSICWRVFSIVGFAVCMASAALALILWVGASKEQVVQIANNLLSDETGFDRFSALIAKSWTVFFVMSLAIQSVVDRRWLVFGTNSPLVQSRLWRMELWSKVWWMKRAGVKPPAADFSTDGSAEA